MVSVPVLGIPLAAATVNLTSPSPRPCCPDTMVIHGSFALAVHVHCADVARTRMVRSPPLASTASRVDESVKSHALPCCAIGSR